MMGRELKISITDRTQFFHCAPIYHEDGLSISCTFAWQTNAEHENGRYALPNASKEMEPCVWWRQGQV